MAREVVVSFQQQDSSFAITRIQREKLYGRKRRVVVDDAGDECVLGQLAVDGSALLPPGGTAMLYVDERGDTVERASLVAKGPDGAPLEKLESTLGRAQALRGPVPPQRVLDHTITAVYQLDPVQLADELKDALAQDQIFETDFTYRDGYERNTAFLLGNDEGYFILVGQAHGLDFIHAETQAVEEEAVEEEDDDELDFSMM